jgi:hypothetical protein
MVHLASLFNFGDKYGGVSVRGVFCIGETGEPSRCLDGTEDDFAFYFAQLSRPLLHPSLKSAIMCKQNEVQTLFRLRCPGSPMGSCTRYEVASRAIKHSG